MYEQIQKARTYRAERGMAALLNPHGLIGRDCKCGACFCCAAWSVARIEPGAFCWSLIGPKPGLEFPRYGEKDYARHAALVAHDLRPNKGEKP